MEEIKFRDGTHIQYRDGFIMYTDIETGEDMIWVPKDV